MPKMIDQVVRDTGTDCQKVTEISNALFLALHKRCYESKVDFLGQELPFELPSMTYFHLMGIVRLLWDRYSCEPGMVSEYMLRLFSREDLEPFSRQMKDWKAPEK